MLTKTVRTFTVSAAALILGATLAVGSASATTIPTSVPTAPVKVGGPLLTQAALAKMSPAELTALRGCSSLKPAAPTVKMPAGYGVASVAAPQPPPASTQNSGAWSVASAQQGGSPQSSTALPAAPTPYDECVISVLVAFSGTQTPVWSGAGVGYAG